MSEPEIALVFTPDPWVEELHRHLTDHGGARVRALVVEPEAALDESYDVLVAGHRWPPLTHALVADVHARGRVVLGVHDREERASRAHLLALGVDALVASDARPDAFVRAIADLAGRRDEPGRVAALVPPPRHGRVVLVGGPPGVGSTEIAIELALALGRTAGVVLLDADDVAPAVSARLELGIEPNLRTAIDAVEHGRGALGACVTFEEKSGLPVVTGIPNAGAWSQVRPGEVVRVLGELAGDHEWVVVDGAGMLEDVGTTLGRGRFATARAMVGEADVVVAVCDPSPHGVARFLSWAVEARGLAPNASFTAVVNRAPETRFLRGELSEEITATLPVAGVMFVPADRRVGEAAWSGTPVGRGPFTRAVAALADAVGAIPRRPPGPSSATAS